MKHLLERLSKGARKVHQVLNFHSQKRHSAGTVRGTATPKESMTLDVQVNISKAARFTVVYRLPCTLLYIHKAFEALSKWGRFGCRPLVYGGLFSLCVKTFQVRVKADERLGLRELKGLYSCGAA